MEEILRQVGYLPELHEDARSEKYKNTIMYIKELWYFTGTGNNTLQLILQWAAIAQLV